MKKINILVFALAAMILMPLAAGCDRFAPDSETILPDGTLSGQLSIGIWDGGFGTQYMENVAEAFEKKYDNVTVKMNPYSLRMTIYGDLLMNKANQKNSLYFLDAAGVYGDSFKSGLVSGYDRPFLDISDVYAHKWEGEDKTIAEKIQPRLLDYFDIDGGKYLVNYGQTAYGITYLPELVEGYLPNGHIPRTTNELEQLCGNIVAANKPYKPFIFSGLTDYWRQMYYTFWAQYEGLENYDRYFRGRILDEETGTERLSPNIFSQVGRLRSLQTINNIIGLSYDSGDIQNWTQQGVVKASGDQFIVSNSAAIDFMSAQTQYLNGSAAMMVNGGWLENEMTSIFDTGFPYDVDFMKVPVISTIRENCLTIADDAELSALIKAIDDGSEALTDEEYNVSQADFNKVKEARGVMYITSEGQFGAIPSAAATPTLAKEFLKFLFSDAGINAYSNALSGQFLPVYGFDYTKNTYLMHGATRMMKTGMELLSESTWIWASNKDDIVRLGGLPSSFIGIETAFAAPNPSDRKTPTRLFMETVSHYSSGSAWSDLLKMAGY